MAIAHDTAVMAAPNATSGRIRLCNVDGERFAPLEFAAEPSQDVDTSTHTWGNYFLCGYKGVFEHCARVGVEAPAAVGLDVCVHGLVPAGAGVSSSSALVVASALAVMAAHGLDFPKVQLAELARVCEQHIGTMSGGMDQAISVLGQRGQAKLVEFNPVRASPVSLPAGHTFVIANCLAVSEKAVSAATQYNYRVVECRLAAAALAVAAGEAPAKAAAEVATLQSAERYYGGREGAVAAVEQVLKDGASSAAAAAEAVGVPLAEVFAGASAAAQDVLAHADVFRLRERARHVYSEARRVEDFKAACDAGGAPAELAAKLGALMDASHASCAGDYDCSCPELQELVGVCKAAGAIGSRLTGAGWGGCTVSLVEDTKVDAFIARVRDDFYAKRVSAGTADGARLGEYVFATRPCPGAALLTAKALR